MRGFFQDDLDFSGKVRKFERMFGSFFMGGHFFEGDMGWCVGFVFQVGLQGS